MRNVLMLLLVVFVTNAATAQMEPKGLHVNDKAPTFIAVDQNGRQVSLSVLMAKGPVVLVFYRGQWCPYCNKQLSNLQDSVSFITGKGATLVAVAPEKPENIQKTIAKTKASYPVLFDSGLTIMKSYDVAYNVGSEMLAKYKKYGIDFNQVNGANGASLPVPTVYIINTSGIITYVNFNPDFTKRPSVSEIVSHL